MTNTRVWRQGATAAAIGTLALVVGSIGVADASNGGSLILGHKNTATKTTTIKDTKGTPLKLKGSKTKPPLKVNSSTVVPKLNASLLDGASAQTITSLGSSVSWTSTIPGGTPLSTDVTSTTALVETAAMPKGRYQVDARAELFTSGSSTGARCYIGVNNADSTSQSGFGAISGSAGTYGNPVESEVVTISTPTVFTEYCYTHDSTAGAYDATITATRINLYETGSVPTARRAAPATSAHHAPNGG